MTVCWKLTLLTAAPDAGEAALEAAGASATATLPDIDDDSGLYKDTVGRSQHRIEAYYDFEPDVTGMALAAEDTFTLEALPDIDWVSEGQKNLKPVHVPPFHLYGSHDRQHKQRAHRGAGHAIEMNAGMAFGSGHHGTTQGCLALLAQHSKRARPRHVADIGCGSGTLAIAAAKLGARQIIASDYDPDAVRVTRDNAKQNGVAPFITPVLAIGMAHETLRAGAPYDVIFANILARPLHQLAGDFSAALAPQGRLILSGLLHEHVRAIRARYRSYGFTVEAQHRIGAWTSLMLTH